MTNDERFSMNDVMESKNGAEMQPSHHVSEHGDKVTIHDLELFVGHIPGFDADDSGMDDLDDEAIENIIARTKVHMSAGSNPKLVMLHQDDSNDAPPEALGDIVDIRRKDIHIRTETGEDYRGPGIIGDVVMSRNDFQDYVASNRFPRRSAEIWKDGHMSEVALLGRETPARPLRDTRFAKAGEKSTFTRPVTFSEVSPGGSNTFVPTFGDEKKENAMPEKEDRLMIEHDGDDKDLISKLRAENDTLRKDLEELKMQMNGDDDEESHAMKDMHDMDDKEEMNAMDEAEEAHYDHEEDEDMMGMKYEEDDEEEDKEMFSKIRRTKNGAKFIKKYKKLQDKKNAYHKLATALGLKLRKSKFSKLIDAMETDGYRIREHRDHMMNELLSSKNADEKIKFWRETMTRNPIGRRLNLAQSRVVGKTEYSASDRKNASDRAVARMTKEGLGADQFQRVFEEEIKAG